MTDPWFWTTFVLYVLGAYLIHPLARGAGWFSEASAKDRTSMDVRTRAVSMFAMWTSTLWPIVAVILMLADCNVIRVKRSRSDGS